MRSRLRLLWYGTLLLLAFSLRLRADVLEMQNGDRYSGKVLGVSADTVVLKSAILGRINVPRSKVTSLTFGTNAAAPKLAAGPVPAESTNLPPAAPRTRSGTNADLSAALRQLGGDTNFIAAIRQQMLAGNPQAAGKYDEMVNGLMSGQLNLADLRRQAKASADQMRDLKRELGPDADEALDPYLKILDAFVSETDGQSGKQP